MAGAVLKGVVTEPKSEALAGKLGLPRKLWQGFSLRVATKFLSTLREQGYRQSQTPCLVKDGVSSNGLTLLDIK